MAPLTAEGSPAPFLNGVHVRLARPKPQLEDDASATDLHKEMNEEEEHNKSMTDQARTQVYEG